MTDTNAMTDALHMAAAAARAPRDSAEVTAAIAVSASLTRDPPAARVLIASLTDVLTAPAPSSGLRVLLSCGALGVLIPPITRIVQLSQESGRRHKDVWEHTLAVVEGVEPDLTLRLAALLHDIGKPDTLKFVQGKGATFHNHPAVGAELAKQCLRATQLGSDVSADVVWLVAHHLRPAEHSEEWSDSAVRRFIRECGPRAGQLLALSRADLTTRDPRKIRRARDNAAALISRMERVTAEDAAPAALRKGFGTWLAERWSLQGRDIGAVKARVEELVERGAAPRLAEHSAYEHVTHEIVEALRSERGDEVRVCEC